MDLQIQTLNWNWTEFCGSNELNIWVNNQYDLSQCFQATCLRLPILSFIAILSSYYSAAHIGWISRNYRETLVIRCRLLITFLLAFLPVIQIIILVLYYSKSLYITNYLISVLELFSWLLHFCYLLSLRHKLGPSLRGPVILGSLWTMFYLITIVHVRSVFFEYQASKSPLLKVNLIFAIVAVLLQTLYGLTMIPSENVVHLHPVHEPQLFPSLYHSFQDNLDVINLGTALEEIGLVSRLFFLWVNPLTKNGVNGKIRTPDDLFDLPEHLSSPALFRKLNRALNVQQNELRRYPNRPKVSLLRALHYSFAKEFYSVGILKFIADISGFIAPLLLSKLLLFIENHSESVIYGYIYAGGIFFASLIGSFLMVHFNFEIGLVGLKLRGSLISKIYHKLFHLPATVITKTSIGEIVNYVSTDIDRIVNSCQSFHAVWSIPFQIIVTLYLLYTQVGIAFIAGVLFSIILIPINKVIANKIGKWSADMMREKDSRVQLMTEVIRGIKTIKLHAWEEHFIGKVLGIRSNEMRYLKYRKYLDAVCVYFWATTPVIISILTFGTFVILGGELNAAIVFTSIALLNMLISPLNAFPWVLNGLIEAWISVNRVQKLFELEDMQYNDYYTNPLEVDEIRHYYDTQLEAYSCKSIASPSGEIIMCMKKGSFSWQTHYFNLFDVSFTVEKGQLVGVYGPVGSGKSSLLAAIIAEIYKVSGTIAVKDLEAGFGYVAQTPWIQHSTVRENIIFGKPHDAIRYRQVIDACALVDDMINWDNGDVEAVGEGGSTLSGGQKARISLARAVYQDKDIYLIDDILSSVDPQVASHIFHKCINGILSNKTCIFVSQEQKFLFLANKVLVLEEGSIVKQGTPQEVLKYVPKKEDTEFRIKVTNTHNHNYSFIKEFGNLINQIEEETSAFGTVQFKIYFSYWKAVGTILATLILIFVILMQITRNATDWWLAVWVSDMSFDSIRNYINVLIYGTMREHNTYFFLSVYVIIGFANSLVTIIRSILFAYGGIKAAVSVHNKLLWTVVKSQMVFFDMSPLGRIINRFSSDMFTVDDSLPFVLNNLFAQLFSVIGTIAMTLYGLPWLCLFLTPLIPLYHSLQNHYRLTSRELKRLSSVTLSPLYSHFTETVAGLATIRAFRETSKFRQENHYKLESSQKCQFSSSAASMWLSIRLQLIGVAIIGGVCLISILQHQFDVAHSGMVGLAISYALSLTSKLGGVVNTFTETEQEMIAVERIREYIDTPLIESSKGRRFDATIPFFWPSQGIVVFSNVYLQYRNTTRVSLRNITFETVEGEKLGIVGRTGAGKSSLFLCLFRIVELMRGTITLDNVDISQISIQKLRSKLAIIPQDPFIFAGTVRENIDPLNKYEDSRIWDSIGHCNLSKVVKNLGGLDANMLSGGVNLSAGEKQLFCLVRAILRNAKVICIDEATSNIDEETDKQIQETISNCFKYSTVLTIAHKINTVLDCDRVLVMGHGELLECGPPKLLLQNPESYFYQLANELTDHKHI